MQTAVTITPGTCFGTFMLLHRQWRLRPGQDAGVEEHMMSATPLYNIPVEATARLTAPFIFQPNKAQ